MKRRPVGLVCVGLVCVPLAFAAVAARQRPPGPEGIDAALTAFWAADDAGAAERAAQRVITSDADFATIFSRLHVGRPYGTQPTGVRQMPTTVDGTRLDNVVDIPTDYDPARPWPLQVQLHGGVARQASPRGQPARRPLGRNRIPGESQIYLYPRAWDGLEWWRAPQVDNIVWLIDAIKRRYNVDESRVYVTGISDGGTGVYFLAMRAATAWSACLPLNGHPAVLANPAVGADPQLYVTNLANCPMYLVNGGRDRLYPAASVAPFVELIRRAGASVEFHVHPEAGHDTSWWPVERPLYEQYLADHPRVAHPASLSWETDRVDRYNRIRWLVIDRLGTQGSDVALEDVNNVERRPGVRQLLYERERPSGRVDVTRDGNRFEVKTRGVGQFTLLLSPDVVNFSKAVHIMVNGRAVFEGTVTRDVATLMKWAVRDNDRTMLYGAELSVIVP